MSARAAGRPAPAALVPRSPRAALLAIVLLAAPGCGGDGDGRSPGERPNVLVVTIDTVRADRLGAYGHAGRDLTPHLDALAEQAVLFERAFSSSSFTPPTHASIFTGLQPSEHGLMHWNKHLGEVPTAAETFREAGWRTGAWTPLPTLLKLGLERGFDVAESPPFRREDDRIVLADADALSAAALPFLTADDARPFFAWVHYYDAHRPYGRQGPEWSGRYVEHDDPAVGATEAWYQLTPEKRQALGVTPEQARLVKDHYDGGLSYLDDRLGRLFDALAAAGVLDRTIVVVIADHGEVLDEHDAEWFSHDPWLVDENVHVPFLLRLPDGAHAGLRVPDLVSQVDVLPTLLSLAGVAPPGPLAGLDLTRTLEGRPLGRAAVFADRIGDDLSGRKGEPATPEEVAASRDRKRMLRDDRRKLVHAVDAGRVELRAVDGSAPETEDLHERPAEHDAFERLLNAYRGLLESLRPPPGAPADASPLDEQTREFLQSIGYNQ